jgi:hypothetical protein
VCGPICFPFVAKSFVYFGCLDVEFDSSARSSANSRSSSMFDKVHVIRLLAFDVISFITQSMHSVKNSGKSKHPCLTPVRIWNS